MRAETLLRSAAAFFAEDEQAPLSAALYTARRREPKAVPLLLSAAKTAGLPLAGHLEAELATAAEKNARYEETLARLRRQVPGLRVLKGPTLARLYPGGLVRGTGDLDLSTRGAAPDRLLHVLAEDGWMPDSATRCHEASRSVVMLRIVRPRPDDGLVPDAIEVATVDWFGNGGIVVPHTDLGPDDVAASLVALSGEAFERPFGFRDAVDVALASRRDPAVLAAAVTLAKRVGSARLLARLIAHSGRVLADDVGPASRVRRRGPAVRVALRQASSLARRPDLLRRAAQMRSETGPAGPVRHLSVLVLRASQRRGPGGLVEFGLPVTSAAGRCDGAPEILRTPIGEFLMVTSATVDPEVLKELGLEPA